jgi:hypothetical protein
MEILSLAILAAVVAFIAIYVFVKIKKANKDGMPNYIYETVVDENGNTIEKVINTNESN